MAEQIAAVNLSSAIDRERTRQRDQLQREQEQERERQQRAERQVRQRLRTNNSALTLDRFEAVETARLQAERARLDATLPPEPADGDGIEVTFNVRGLGGGALRFVRRFQLMSPAELIRTAVLAHPEAPDRRDARIVEGYPKRNVPLQGTLQDAFGGRRQVEVNVSSPAFSGMFMFTTTL